MLRDFFNSIIYNRFKQQTIGTHLIFLISTTLVTVVLSLGILYIWHEYDIRIQESKKFLKKEVEEQVRSVNEWFRDNSYHVETVSQLQSVRNYDKEGILHDFKASLTSNKDFDGYAFVDKSGVTTVDAIAPPGTDVNNRQYFRLGMQGKPYITDIIVGRATGRRIIIFSRPVFSKDQDISGVVFATVSVKTLDNIIQGFEFGKTGRAYLIDNNSSVIAQFGVNENNDRSLEDNEGYRRAKSGLAGADRYTNHNGQSVVGAYQWIPERNWALLFEIDEREILQPLYDLAQKATIGSTLILLLAILVTWLISRNIQEPILALFLATEKTQTGDYSTTISKEKFSFATVEIRGLCNAFNIMMETINEHITLLRDTNEALIVAENKYRTLSIRDQLTQLYNRTYFEVETSRLQSLQQIPVGVVVCDVDGLKLINDMLGHKAGDDLIRAAANSIVKSFPVNAMVARIGGDEFAVLMPGAGSEEVQGGIRKLTSLVKEHNMIHPELPLAISSGGVTATKLPLKIEDVVSEADNYMYQEKNRNRAYNRQVLLSTLIQTAGENDNNYNAHIKGVQKWALLLGKVMHLDDSTLHDIELTAQYHDIGKVGVPKEILTKHGMLTEEEWVKIRLHSEIGGRMAKSISELVPIADFITAHHEWWDGSGYPEKMKEEAIPLISRIIAIADAYDAMQRNSFYRQAMSQVEAEQELVRCAGKQFDPNLVNLLLQAKDRLDA